MTDVNANNGEYSQRYTASHPGLIIFLIDQSYSMCAPFIEGRIPHGELAIRIVNETISRIIDHHSGPGIAPGVIYVTAWAYSDVVWSVIPDGGLPIDVNYLANHSTVFRRALHISSGRQTDERAAWIYSHIGGTNTDLGAALARATRIVQEWLAGPAIRQYSFPPVVINITDGESGRSHPDFPLRQAQTLKSTHNHQGNTLLFNVCLTDSGKISRYPVESGELEPKAMLAFEMSSELPDTLSQRIQRPQRQFRCWSSIFRRSARPAPACPSRALICHSDVPTVVDTLCATLLG